MHGIFPQRLLIDQSVRRIDHAGFSLAGQRKIRRRRGGPHRFLHRRRARRRRCAFQHIARGFRAFRLRRGLPRQHRRRHHQHKTGRKHAKIAVFSPERPEFFQSLHGASPPHSRVGFPTARRAMRRRSPVWSRWSHRYNNAAGSLRSPRRFQPCSVRPPGSAPRRDRSRSWSKSRRLLQRQL